MTELLDLATTVVNWALPGEQVEAYVARSQTASIKVYDGEIESVSAAEPAGAGIRVIHNGRQGFAWAGLLEETVLKETLEEARDNATFGEPDEFFGLAAADGVAPPDLDLVRAELAALPTSAKVDLALELERLTRARDPRVTGVEVASYSDSRSEVAIATTTGIAAAYASGMCLVSVDPLLEEAGETQVGYGYSAGRGPSEIDLGAAAEDAVARAARLLGGTKPHSRRLTAVLDPEVTADFLAIIGSTLSGEALLKGRSLFANRDGERVAAEIVSLASDPTDERGFSASRYDGEGLARRRVALIEAGHLQGFLHNTYSGRRSGRASTGSASRSYQSAPAVGAPALTLVPGSKNQDELIAELTDAVYVQDVSGLHSGVNPVSGDFSVGATGLMIRDGVFAEPFREATIASTLQRMLLDVIAVGADHRWLASGCAGLTLVIKDVSLSGT